jgi:hypothetical protein
MNEIKEESANRAKKNLLLLMQLFNCNLSLT